MPPTAIERSEPPATPPTTNAWAATTDLVARVAFRQIRPDQIHGGAHHRLVPGLTGDLQSGTSQFRLQIGQCVDRDRSGVVGQHDRLADPGDRGSQMQTPGGQEVGERAESRSRIVIAGRGDDDRPGRPDPLERPGRDLNRFCRGHGAVVDVAGHDDCVDLVLGHQIGERGQHELLVRQQVLPVEGPADVPVRGVQQSHDRSR